MRSGVGFFRSRRAGSPGTARTSRKTAMLATNSATTSDPIRRSRNTCMGWSVATTRCSGETFSRGQLFQKDFGEGDAEDGADDAGDGEVRGLRLPGVFFFQGAAQLVDGDHLVVDQVGEAAEGVLATGGGFTKDLVGGHRQGAAALAHVGAGSGSDQFVGPSDIDQADFLAVEVDELQRADLRLVQLLARAV